MNRSHTGESHKGMSIFKIHFAASITTSKELETILPDLVPQPLLYVCILLYIA